MFLNICSYKLGGHETLDMRSISKCNRFLKIITFIACRPNVYKPYIHVKIPMQKFSVVTEKYNWKPRTFERLSIFLNASSSGSIFQSNMYIMKI